ncbi:MAG: S-layer homology domain-containing protein [Clostridia bacterium]|nr:S-layer homology domain-containing protein [Clostridia bacterium]
MKRIISLIITTVMLLSVFGTASFADFELPALPFDDLVDGAWYMEGIEYCYDYGIVNGMTETTFVPNGTLTRAQFVQMLAGLDGADLSEYVDAESGFEDVSVGAWYNAAVCWAKENEYAAGVSETRFAPNDPMTREQRARFFYTYGLSYVELGFDMSASDDLSAFEDADTVSDWALDGVKWCVAAGIISGMTETTIAPRETATRAQACRMIMGFDEYILSGGPKDTDGAFRVMADYITANGKADEYFETCFVIEENIDGVLYRAFYDPEGEMIQFEYCAGPSDDEYIGDTVYLKDAFMIVDGLRTAYAYIYADLSQEDKLLLHTGYMKADGFEEYALEYDGYTEAEAKADADEVMGRFTDFVNGFLDKCGVTAEEFYKVPVEE